MRRKQHWQDRGGRERGARPRERAVRPAGPGRLREVGAVGARPCRHAPGRRRRGLRCGSARAGQAWPAAVARWLGSELEPPVPVDDRDKRFADPAWDGNPGYFALRQAYLAARRLGEDLLAAGQGDPVADQKATARRRPRLRRACPDQLPAHQPGRAEEGVRDRRRQRARRGRATSSTMSRTTTGGRARSTAQRSSWAATSRRPPGRWCSATT